MNVNAGARLDRLPVSGFHKRIMWLIGIGMFFDGFDIYVASTVLGAIGLLALPNTTYLYSSAPWLKWTVVLLAFLIRTTAGTMAFTSVNVLVNESAPNDTGKANGVAFALAGLVKTVGPAAASILLAWSLTNGIGFPLDFRFVFVLMALFNVVLLVGTLFLPAHLGINK